MYCDIIPTDANDDRPALAYEFYVIKLCKERGKKGMSQEKIDAYKKEKAGRKERLAKQKKRKKIAKIVCLIVVVALALGIAGAVIWNKRGTSVEATEGASVETSVDASSVETSEEAANESSEASSEEASAETSEAEAASEASSN